HPECFLVEVLPSVAGILGGREPAQIVPLAIQAVTIHMVNDCVLRRGRINPHPFHHDCTVQEKVGLDPVGPGANLDIATEIDTAAPTRPLWRPAPLECPLIVLWRDKGIEFALVVRVYPARFCVRRQQNIWIPVHDQARSWSSTLSIMA